jgi:hypothetical protein
MTIETLPQPPVGQPRWHAVGQFRDLWAWLRRDHGIWTDIFFGAIPLVPMMILLAMPGNTLVKAMAEYGLLAVLIFVGLFLHGVWRQLRSWSHRRAAKM